MPIKIDPVSTIIETGAKAVETVAGVFSENAEKGAQRAAEEQKALLQSYQAEFSKGANRGLIDMIADGFNRLIRPFIVSLIMFVFVVAYVSPERFVIISQAMGAVPPGYWALLSVIIGFYFGGRMQLKSQDFQMKQSHVNAVKSLIETKREFRKLEMDNDESDRALGDTLGKDASVDITRNGHSNGVVEAYQKALTENKQQEMLAAAVNKVKAASDKDDPQLFVLDMMSEV